MSLAVLEVLHEAKMDALHATKLRTDFGLKEVETLVAELIEASASYLAITHRYAYKHNECIPWIDRLSDVLRAVGGSV